MYNELFTRPFFNLTIAIYNAIPGGDLGLAIIAMTVIIRAALYPAAKKAALLKRKMDAMNPKIQEIKTKHKDNREAQTAALTKLYKDEGANPIMGCLPLLIQIPIIFALYKVFLNVSAGNGLDTLYSFISRPDHINQTFLGFVDLAKASPVMAVMAGAFQFLQARQASAGQTPAANPDPMTSAINTQMLYFFPVIIIIVSWSFPAGLTLYWITTTLFSIAEQFYIAKRFPAPAAK